MREVKELVARSEESPVLKPCKFLGTIYYLQITKWKVQKLSKVKKKCPFVLTNITSAAFKHCLQMFMHIISNIVWSCSCWHIKCTLHRRSANWRIIWGTFKVAGHYRGGKGWTALQADKEGETQSPSLITSWHQKLGWSFFLFVLNQWSDWTTKPLSDTSSFPSNGFTSHISRFLSCDW